MTPLVRQQSLEYLSICSFFYMYIYRKGGFEFSAIFIIIPSDRGSTGKYIGKGCQLCCHRRKILCVLGEHSHRPIGFSIPIGTVGIPSCCPSTTAGSIDYEIGTMTGIFDSELLVFDSHLTTANAYFYLITYTFFEI